MEQTCRETAVSRDAVHAINLVAAALLYAVRCNYSCEQGWSRAPLCMRPESGTCSQNI